MAKRRSISFPFSGNHGYMRNLRRSLSNGNSTLHPLEGAFGERNTHAAMLKGWVPKWLNQVKDPEESSSLHQQRHRLELLKNRGLHRKPGHILIEASNEDSSQRAWMACKALESGGLDKTPLKERRPSNTPCYLAKIKPSSGSGGLSMKTF